MMRDLHGIGWLVRRLALSAVTGALLMALLEVACRVKTWREDQRYLEAYSAMESATNAAPPPTQENVRLRDIIRHSPNTRRIYSLKPNLDVRLAGWRLTTDPEGWRRMPPISSNGPVVSVVGLGDSVMLGWGVADEESYLYRLQGLLEQHEPGLSWQVINLSVPGYNTVMEVETFREQGLLRRPHLVLLEYVGNDLDLPNFIIERENYFTLQKSFLLEQIQLRRKNRTRERWASKLMKFRAAPKAEDRSRFESDPHKVPRLFRDMVGVEAYQDAVGSLARLARRHDFEVILLAAESPPDHVRRVSAEYGIPLVELKSVVDAFFLERGLPPSAMSVSASDPHPSALAHQVIAQELFDFMVRSGTLDRLRQRAQR
jgi:hypothetical protein